MAAPFLSSLVLVLNFAVLIISSVEAAVIEINPGTTIQNIVSAQPPGTTFLLKAGVHRNQVVTPKDGQIFIGETDASGTLLTTLSGANVLTNFTREGPLWVASNQIQQGQLLATDECMPDAPRCAHPNDLYLNNVPLRHVDSKSAVGAGKFFFDYAADKIYFADDPAGKTVETAVTPRAFEGSALNVSIKHLIVEKYATPSQHAAILSTGRGWIVEDNILRLNHALGLDLSKHSEARRNKIYNNGQMGVGGGGEADDLATGIIFENNELYGNNYARYDASWEGGGLKFTFTDGAILRNNHSHHNNGWGLWTDIDNINTLYEGNLVEHNTDSGIAHEISHNAIIRNNVLRYNGQNDPFYFGAQLLIQNSEDVEVYGNKIVVKPDHGHAISIISQNRGNSEIGRGPYLGRNNYIHDNEITFEGEEGIVGTVCEAGSCGVSPSSFPFLGNRFERNIYHVSSLSSVHWLRDADTDNDYEFTWPGWQALGYDAGSCIDIIPNRLCGSLQDVVAPKAPSRLRLD